ncbi:MAG: glycosyltransferase family 1 protein [Candidatus Saccharimonadales bacterium]
MRSEAYLPSAIAGLWQLATNLRWTWHRPTQVLFRDLNPAAWKETAQDPLHQLSGLSSAYLDELARNPDFVQRVQDASRELREYLTGESWFERTYPGVNLNIAYFSPEFGISEALPQYSGGLGVLAGDHLKTASDLGVPLVGIGLFYQYGYFNQEVRFGRQAESYRSQTPQLMGLELCRPEVVISAGGYRIVVRIWLVRIGRTKLYLLDTSHSSNNPSLQSITDRLYGGDHLGERRGGEREHRLLQEIVLGIGGVKALRALGEPVNLYHSNEGHAGFSGLERVRELVQDRNLAFRDAVAEVRESTIFTTHTPVPAGIDRFGVGLMSRYFDGLAEDCGVSLAQVLALGQAPGEASGSDFNMAYLGLRMAQHANGVSKLHGEVSRKMFAHLYGVPADDTPIGSVTNGVHPQTWTPQPMQRLFHAMMGSEWFGADGSAWSRMQIVRDDALWRLRCDARSSLVEFARKHMREHLLAVGSNDAEWCREAFDPEVLTIGFARRKASYKRLLLLLHDPDRLKRLMLDVDRPVQFIIAGKAHPHDQSGHDIIEKVANFAFDPQVRRRIAFLPNYDLGVARAMLDADVWLNTPIRPHEASGTSGEKSVYHGGLQLSVNDGWWDEMARHGKNGWTIEEGADEAATAENLYRLIETDLREAFYERDAQGVPTRWTGLMKSSLATLGAKVSSHRMLQDYVSELYIPAFLEVHDAVR